MNPHKYQESDTETVQLKRVVHALRERYPDGLVGARPTDRRVIQRAGFGIITFRNYDAFLAIVSEWGYDVATPVDVLEDFSKEGLLDHVETAA